MIDGFVNPALALGALLAALPIIIHLLNRQRHKPVPWAAMRFVLAAYRRTRRRVQLENLLLLLLRVLAVAAFAFAVARPFAKSGGPLTLRESRRDLVLVIDGSASTAYRDGLGTVFERITERAARLLEGLDAGRGDRAQIVFAGAWPRLSSWSSPEEAVRLLSTLTRPTDEPLDLAAALAEVARLAGEGADALGSQALDVRLLTDMQRRSFETTAAAQPGPGGEAAPIGADEAVPELVRELDALRAANVRVLVEDLGPAAERPANLTVSAIEPLSEVPPAGGAFEVAVVVENHGAETRRAERVWLEVDGERLPSARIDVPAGGNAEAVFAVVIDDAGHHALVGGTGGDSLAVDDQRAEILAVPPPIRVLVVNGAPADRFDEDEVALLMTVLEPPDEGSMPGLSDAAPFTPIEVRASMLGSESSGLEDADVIVLANVATLTDDVRSRLEARVAAGASLLVTAGDRMGDLASWSEGLFRADGTGLLPAEPLRRVSTARRESYFRVATFDASHPALAFFEEERWRPLLTEVPFYEFIATRPGPRAVVLARFDDAAGSPLLVEHEYGAGRVALWTSSISKAWNLVPQSPGTFVPLVHELVRHLGRSRPEARSLPPGSDVRLLADTFLRSPELVRPDGVSRSLGGDAVETPGGRWALPQIPSADTEHVGVYEVRAAGAPPERFAIQLDPAEGDLARASAREIEALHPALRVFDADATGDDAGAGDEDRGGELWRLLAAGALLFLVLESLFGAWLGRRRGRIAA